VSKLFNIVPAWLWLLVLAATYSVWVTHQRDELRRELLQLQASTAKAEAARLELAVMANSNFRKFEHQQAATAAELESANQTRKLAAGAVDSSNRDDVDGLRRDVAKLDLAARASGLPSAAACPGELETSRRSAEIARGLHLACAAEYQELASDAQRDAIDLDTAVKYGDLVQQDINRWANALTSTPQTSKP
jgi:hypothetical protein